MKLRNVLLVDCGDSQVLRRGITWFTGENGMRGQARPGVYFYKYIGGDPYVTVTLRDLNARRVLVR